MKKLFVLSTLCLTFALVGCSKKDGGGDGEAAAGASVEITKLGLKADAPEGTKVSEMLGNQMLQGPGLVLTVAEAGADDAKDMAAAVKDMKDTYDGVTNVKEEKLADGWIFTAENKGGMGTNYWVKGYRTIGDKSFKCETTAAQAEQQANAVAACKSLAAAAAAAK